MNQNYGFMAMSLIQKHNPFTVPYVIIACISNIHLKHVSENIDSTGDLCSNVTLCNLLKGPSKLTLGFNLHLMWRCGKQVTNTYKDRLSNLL